MKINITLKLLFCFSLMLGFINICHAKDQILVTDGYVKANIPGSSVTAAYMTISNPMDKAITLQKVTSDISPNIEIHEHSMSNGMMRMREVGQIKIDANSKVVLQPSGLHLMIFSVTEQISEKDSVVLTLHFADQSKINIQLPVSQYK
ncbi:copper chaperone PCu(A)C [Colwellia echini]|uniref:Copper chaperone PCu(A)C n=1 Tax=Colwellia echini TaxID=1982103 RepID=A0ABY3N0F3_9GAMM|nr:copper chaperone PCu(A)C [Colwellia echini]TYK66981.1 copper chaperone PCu(A)C [Colwellia echini]